jgi:hypothetical protein
MSEITPHFAPIVVVLFLGSVFFTGVSILVLAFGAVRGSLLLVKIGSASAIAIVTTYALLLGIFSLASGEKTLAPGGWKYFCEIDCHIGYSVSGTDTVASFGPEISAVSAHGQFVVVHLRVWFDEHTISAHRGNGPLTSNPRRVVLVDANGSPYEESQPAEASYARLRGEEPSLAQPLRPGESFTKSLVFDVPKDARGLRLLIIEDDPESHLLISHENSPFHKKIYLGLDSAPTITSAISPLD